MEKQYKWTIETTTLAEDIIASALFDVGIVGVEIEDNIIPPLSDQEGMYIEDASLPEDDGKAKINFYVKIVDDKDGLSGNNILNSNTVDNSYFEGDENKFTKDNFKVILQNIKKELENIRQYVDAGSCNIEATELEDTNWIKKWRENFKDIVAKPFVIKPVWEKTEDNINSSQDIFIDPGMAFGTGAHETTRLAIQGLTKHLKKGNTVLDIGTGSGILGLCSLKLGAKKIIATDLDEIVAPAVFNNLRANYNEQQISYILNGKEIKTEEEILLRKYPKLSEYNYGQSKNKTSMEGRELKRESFSEEEINGFRLKPDANNQKSFNLYIGNLLDDKTLYEILKIEKVDVVVANILAPVIILLAPCITDFVKDGGYFIATGILDTKENSVKEAFSKNTSLHIVDTEKEGEWIQISAQVKKD